jgi:uncharacterized membrane protein
MAGEIKLCINTAIAYGAFVGFFESLECIEGYMVLFLTPVITLLFIKQFCPFLPAIAIGC